MPELTQVISPRSSLGFVAPGFEPVRDQIDAYLLTDADYSVQVAVYHRDELVVDLAGGAELDVDSVAGVFSASKGVAALVIAKLVTDGDLDLDERVTTYWPEFGAHGKGALTVTQLLSHQSGVLAPEGGFRPDDLLDSRDAAERVAAARPAWVPGSAFGYHGLAVGIFMEELVRRVRGTSLQHVYESEIRAPRDIDFYLGVPAEVDHRYRPQRPVTFTAAQLVESQKKPWSPYSVKALALGQYGMEISDMSKVWFSPNQRSLREAGFSASSGVGSARGLAKAYAAALGFIDEPFASPEVIARMAQQQVWGHDRVLDATMCFGTVFMKPMPREDFGSYLAFGHDGGGGSIGFADPLFDLTFAYVALPAQYMGGGTYAGGVLPRPMRLAELARDGVQRRLS